VEGRHTPRVDPAVAPPGNGSVNAWKRDGYHERRRFGEHRTGDGSASSIARVTKERELKLEVDSGFVLPDLGGKPLPPRTFTTTYFDTAGRRLLGAGITLRRRVESRAGVWLLELPSEDGQSELEERGGPARPPEAFLRLLPALLRGAAALEPIAKLRTRRAGVSVGTRADRVDVVVDRVAVLDGTRVAGSFAEAEAAVAAGDGSALDEIGKTLRKAGARRAADGSSLARVLGAEEAPAPEETPLERLRALLVEQYRALLANDPGVRLGGDPEALHQLRVATRRARALLRAARGLVSPDWAEPLRAELKWLGGLLGPVRDLDVLLEHLDSEAATLETEDARAFRRLRARLVAQRREARDTLLEAMSGARYFRILDALEGAAEAPAGELPKPLAEIAAKAFTRLRKAAEALPARPTDEELHQVRIETKRARYAAELAAPELGKRGARLVDRAKTVQDVIGDHQDACVAEDRLRELALRGGGKTGLAAGRLVERQRRRKADARRAFPDAWRKLNKAGRKAFA
jgi:CHAD domain-containing protein